MNIPFGKQKVQRRFSTKRSCFLQSWKYYGLFWCLSSMASSLWRKDPIRLESARQMISKLGMVMRQRNMALEPKMSYFRGSMLGSFVSCYSFGNVQLQNAAGHFEKKLARSRLVARKKLSQWSWPTRKGRSCQLKNGCFSEKMIRGEEWIWILPWNGL